MKRAIVAVLAAGVAAFGSWLLLRDLPSYPELRQASFQEIPGTLGYAVEPAPDELRPELTPTEVKARYPVGSGEVQVSLASLRDTYQDRILGSGWVLVARGVCLRNQKGELVSDARGSDPVDLDCTDETIWVLAVDPSTGDPLAAVVGFDARRAWTMDVGV
jgi:hypothetical protein